MLEGSFEVIDGAERAAQLAGDWRQISLRPDEREHFAHAAALLRWDGEEQQAPVAPGRLLAPRRCEDRATDLWTTFNVVQENLVRGGQKGTERNANGARKSVREIKGIDGNVALNRALWALTERMAGIKAAA